MYLIIKTDSETSDLGRISTPFTTLPTLKDIVNWKFLYPSKILFESLDDDIDVDVIPTFLKVCLKDNRIEFDIATFHPITNGPLDIISPILDESTKGWMKWG